MFNSRTYYNSRPGGFGVLEVVGEEEESRLFVPLKRSALRGAVAGPLASLQLTQVYGYSRPECDKVLEAAYRFPLPGDAAVTGVRVRFGEVEIEAELKPREQAEADYEQAKQEGRQATLVSRESPNVFTVRVAGIRPDEEVTVETSYVQLARAQGAGWALRIPLTTAPRYVRSDELTSRHAQGQPLALLRDPGHRFSLDLALQGASAVESSTHRLQATPEGDGLRVCLQEGEVVPDRDCVLHWRPQQDEQRPALQVYAHDDEAAGHVYFLAQVAPPAGPAPASGLAREVILLVDHSGSMNGAKWDAADWAVVKFLSELSEGDAFNLCLFHSTTRWFAERPQRADARTVERAGKFLREHRDSGGTELGVALEQGLSMPRMRGDYARHLLVMTDAQVSDAGRILRLAEEEIEAAERRRISVLCIDAAPNDFLASQLAERGGGLARFLTSAPEEEDISTALDEVLADWAQPVLADLRLSVDRPEALAAGRAVGEGGAIDLGDMPAGRTVWVAGRAARGTEAEVTFELAARGGQVGACGLDLAAEPSRPALKALFGAWRVAGLEFLISSGRSGDELRDQLAHLGFDPAQALAGQGKPRVYAENARQDAQKALRGLLMSEALAYGLASSETAFVAVRKERGRVVEATAIVANALPSGWSDEPLPPAFFGYSLRSTPSAAATPPPDVYFCRDTADSTPAFLQSSPVNRGGRGMLRRMRSSEQAQRPDRRLPPIIFSGVPDLSQGEALLFDTARAEDADTLPEEGTLSRVLVTFAARPPSLNPNVELLLYVDDLAAPRAHIGLIDVVRQGGQRPLNVRREAGQRVRVVLVDPARAWAAGMPPIEVRLLVS